MIQNVKKTNIIYWVTTVILFLMEGLMPALTSQTEMAKQGISHLGYPVYFGNALVVFKVLGALALLIPQVPKRIKELAYAGFLFDFIFASISHFAVDGFDFQFITKEFISNDLKSYLAQKRAKMNKGDRKSTRLNSSHSTLSRMPSSA